MDTPKVTKESIRLKLDELDKLDKTISNLTYANSAGRTAVIRNGGGVAIDLASSEHYDEVESALLVAAKECCQKLIAVYDLRRKALQSELGINAEE